jgi:MFS family permease
LASSPTTVPLWRNREFVLLETGRLLSNAGSESTAIAYPLLVLALTHSPAKAGIVAFARTIPYPLFALLAGVAADRWNRKWLMIGADCARALAIGTLAALILLDRAPFWTIPVVAFVEGSGSVIFGLAQTGALRAVVPRPQLPAAVGAQRARASAVALAGPPIGGALFAVGRAVPFVADSASYAFSILSLAAMRTPFQEKRELDPSRLRSQIAEGFRFLWAQPFIRATTFLYALGNVTVPAVLLVLVVVGKRQGLSSSAIGGLVAVFGASLLVGSLASPLFRRAFSMRTIILIELWTSLGTVFFLVWPSVWILAAGILPQAVAMPVTDSVVVGYRVAVTPDRLLGRAESVRSNIARLIDPFGALAAGFLLSVVSARATVAVFLVWSVALLLWGTLSPSIRNAPSLDELETAQVAL